ncbi:HAD family hydrolase [Paracoccus siganidrum]|uniref:phosphoglycolate phosphatase n=1 Tax=Paracoccus siganidrum TaxID=1276757 RepID=A0A418ZYZ7_9RHOB|nr:HAD family phosphatase [Paracoccus siganidrum]RJL05721.1 HAD family phosphatase [Paracoccus siganidrum]RMC26992.1 HAD family hydrolase [Paracoccus siganidrum]
MRQFKAILFDCDGVLLDSEPLGCAAIAQAMTAAGVAMTTAEAMALFCGNSSAASLAVIERAGLDPQTVTAHADRLLFAMFDQHIPLIAGIERVLWGFDVPMAVCSNSLIRRLDRSIARTPLAHRFGPHIYSAEHVAAAKPAPDLAIFAADQLGVASHEAIFVDDNPHGLRCGIEAGCLTVGFVGPSEQRPDHALKLAEAGADHIVHGMDAFHALLSRLSLPVAA